MEGRERAGAQAPRPESDDEREIRAMARAQKELLAQHEAAHGDKPYHSVEHIQRVMARAEHLAEAAGLSEQERALLLLVAAGHDLVLHSSVDAQSGMRRRARGGSSEPAHDVEGNPLPRNEYESAAAIIAALEDARGAPLSEALREKIIALCDATYPEIALEPAGPDDLVAHTADGEVDLAGYAIGERGALPHALAIRHPYLTEKSSVEEFLLAWADIGNIGMDDFADYLAQGNAEFREIEQRWTEEELPRLRQISLKRKAAMAHKMLEWWRLQVTLPLMQRNIFHAHLRTMPALKGLTPKAREKIASLMSHFDENAVRAARWYDKAVAEFGDLVEVASWQRAGVPEAAEEAFAALCAHMGYKIPVPPPPASRGGKIDGY